MPELPNTPSSRKNPQTRSYVGIDPGKQGGIVLISPISVVWWSIPETELDLWNVFTTVQALTCRGAYACIENVHASPQGGVSSMFTFGYGYGRLRLGLVAIGLPHDLVRPQEWQGALNIPSRKKGTGPKIGFRKSGGEKDKEWKERLRARAQQVFPALSLWRESKKMQYAIADALLIAEYCRRKYED